MNLTGTLAWIVCRLRKDSPVAHAAWMVHACVPDNEGNIDIGPIDHYGLVVRGLRAETDNMASLQEELQQPEQVETLGSRLPLRNLLA